MLAHIGSVDAELRDHLIYRTFVDLLSDNLLNPQQLQYLFETVTGDDFYIYILEKKQQIVSLLVRFLHYLLLAFLQRMLNYSF